MSLRAVLLSKQALIAASDGDVVLVARGVYTGYGNRDLDFADMNNDGKIRVNDAILILRKAAG